MDAKKEQKSSMKQLSSAVLKMVSYARIPKEKMEWKAKVQYERETFVREIFRSLQHLPPSMDGF